MLPLIFLPSLLVTPYQTHRIIGFIFIYIQIDLSLSLVFHLSKLALIDNNDQSNAGKEEGFL